MFSNNPVPRLHLLCAPLLFLSLLPSLPALSQNVDTGNGVFATRVRTAKKPRLTVVISIDQFRADYLRRLNDLFLPAVSAGKPGGFNYLMQVGSYFIDARYTHYPTFTGPGHSVILTGSHPYKNGIVANEWWDRATRSQVYCVDDARLQVVGKKEASKAKPMGPKNLRVTTVGDELKLATNNTSKVVTLALKDRAAILLGGHNMDASIWYDDYTGRWISSTAYCKDGKLPAWVEAVNAQEIPQKALGKTWNSTLSPEALKRALPPNLPPTRDPYNIGRTFPHTIGKTPERTNYRGFTLTPYANEYVFDTAKQAVLGEKLGLREGASDLLAINLSTNDYVGHAFGPYSPEATEITVQTDRQIADFLNFLNRTVPGGLKEVVFVVTADHGVVPIVENLQVAGVEADRVLDSKIEETVQKTLAETFGGGIWLGKGEDGKAVGAYVEPYLYLSESAIAAAIKSGKATSRAQIEMVAGEAIAAIPGIYACYTRTQLMQGQYPLNEITKRAINGFHPKISGDVMVVSDPGHYTDPGTPGPYATSHGTPYAYDTHVPILIAGPSIRAGVWADPVTPADIAPTLCALLGIELPSGCDGIILKSALK